MVHQLESKRNLCVVQVDGIDLHDGCVDAARVGLMSTSLIDQWSRSPRQRGRAKPNARQFLVPALAPLHGAKHVASRHATKIVADSLHDDACKRFGDIRPYKSLLSSMPARGDADHARYQARTLRQEVSARRTWLNRLRKPQMTHSS